jgi:hypothetical protein
MLRPSWQGVASAGRPSRGAPAARDAPQSGGGSRSQCCSIPDSPRRAFRAIVESRRRVRRPEQPPTPEVSGARREHQAGPREPTKKGLVLIAIRWGSQPVERHIERHFGHSYPCTAIQHRRLLRPSGGTPPERLLAAPLSIVNVLFDRERDCGARYPATRGGGHRAFYRNVGHQRRSRASPP